MIRRRSILLAFVAAGACAGLIAACGNKQTGGSSGSGGGGPAVVPAPPDDATAMIDQEVEALWKQAGVTPAPDASDPEFLRRVTLDLAGRIPTQAEVTEFLAATAADKRAAA